MESVDEVSDQSTAQKQKQKQTFTFPTNVKGESGIANLIEAAEMIRRNKIETGQSFTETFFSAAKQYLA